MNTREIIHHNLAMFAAALTFLLFLPLFPEKPSFSHEYAGISADQRPLFVQLAGPAGRTDALPIQDASSNGTPDIALEESGKEISELERSSGTFTMTLAYDASMHFTRPSGEVQAESVFSLLQDMGTQIEGILAYSAPALKHRRDRHSTPAI